MDAKYLLPYLLMPDWNWRVYLCFFWGPDTEAGGRVELRSVGWIACMCRLIWVGWLWIGI